jgi:hypothetical protein
VILMLLCLSTLAYAEVNWTTKDTQDYFKELSHDKQKAFIKEVIARNQENLPIQLDEHSQLVRFMYMSSSNAAIMFVHVDLPHDSLDQQAVEELTQEAKQYAINSTCSKIMFKMFMFETDMIMRTEYNFTSGHRLLTFSINKNDCIEAGFSRH